MEELEALDEKAITEEYINSYTYNTRQKAWGCVLASIVICALIFSGCILFMSLIGHFVG